MLIFVYISNTHIYCVCVCNIIYKIYFCVNVCVYIYVCMYISVCVSVCNILKQFVLAGVALVLKYLAKGIEGAKNLVVDDSSGDVREILDYLQAVDAVKHSSDDQHIARLVEQHHLTREHVPTPMLQSVEVWLLSHHT